MKLLYIANIRLPTEKAHGLQIMQNCEAFADTGADVTLWVARRVNTAELRSIHDVWAHYGIKRNFRLSRLPCIDLLPLIPGRSGRIAQAIFQIQVWTFTLAVLLRAIFTQADIIYSRDEVVILVLSLIKPKKTLVYEAHTLALGWGGRALQRWAARRAGHAVATNRQLVNDLIKMSFGEGASLGQNRVILATNGIRRERFAHLPDRAAARRELGWSDDLFVVGYVGRLQTMQMDKGVGALVEALAALASERCDCALALVGGPDEMAAEFRARWIELGLDAARFLYAGQVAPERVPIYLNAFDLCAMPFPWTTHFAYHASPIKLFEYMASQRPIVASNLPSIAELVTDGESALLTTPADVPSLAAAIRRLRDDPALRDRLAESAYRLVMEQYTWDARAKMILAELSDQAGSM